MSTPAISIITITRNDAPGLGATLSSIARQTYANIEFVVIDGGDDEESPALISANEILVNRYVREPDRGIYDAMNKGLDLATGEFLCFVNSGDCLFSEDTLQQVADAIDGEVDVVFGEAMLVDGNYRDQGLRSQATTQKLPEELNWRSMEFGMVVSHQAFYARRTLAPRYIGGNLCADIDWVIRILKASRKNVRVDKPLAKFLSGGISQRRYWTSMWDRYHVLSSHFGRIRTTLNHPAIIVRSLFFSQSANNVSGG